jgi:hypothetical protein
MLQKRLSSILTLLRISFAAKAQRTKDAFIILKQSMKVIKISYASDENSDTNVF